MKKWQSFIINHHSNAIVLNDTQVKIPEIGYSTVSKEVFYDIITKHEDGYFVETFLHDTNNRIESYATETVKEYLGY